VSVAAGTPGGETPAMLAFIAQSFPQAPLAPVDDPFAFLTDHRRRMSERPSVRKAIATELT
jgi:hypothetical protein